MPRPGRQVRCLTALWWEPVAELDAAVYVSVLLRGATTAEGGNPPPAVRRVRTRDGSGAARQ